MRAVWRALQHTLRVPPQATAREVRVNGGIAVAVGLVVIIGSALIAAALEKVTMTVGFGRLMLAVIFVGYGLIIIGGYRALTGRHPAAEQHDALSSLRRIGTGIFVVVAAFGLLLALLLIVGWVMGGK